MRSLRTFRGLALHVTPPVVLLGALACQPSPSYELRWRVDAREGQSAVPPTSPTACSRNGVAFVGTWVVNAQTGELADYIEHPCFPLSFRNAEAVIGGGELPSGEYIAVAQGLRTSGTSWLECADPGLEPGPQSSGFDAPLPENFRGRTPQLRCPGSESFCTNGSCPLGSLSCDCTPFEIREGETTALGELVLPAPPECDDGVDSDGDGLVDRRDPGCLSSDSERTPVLQPELALEVSFFGNVEASCSAGVGQLQVSIDGEVAQTSACRTGLLRVSTPLSVGPHELSVVALSGTAQPLTRPRTFPFEVFESGGVAPARFDVDFADIDFLEPVVQTARFALSLQLPELVVADDQTGSNRVFPATELTCATSGADQLISFDSFSLQLLDASGTPVEPAPMAQLATASDAVPLDGTPTGCIAQTVITEPLSWGAFLVQATAADASGAVCFATREPVPLVPGSSSVEIPLFLAEEAPQTCDKRADLTP